MVKNNLCINQKKHNYEHNNCLCNFNFSQKKSLHDLTCKIKNCEFEDHFKRGFDLSKFNNWSIISISLIFNDKFKQYINSKFGLI